MSVEKSRLISAKHAANMDSNLRILLTKPPGRAYNGACFQ